MTLLDRLNVSVQMAPMSVSNMRVGAPRNQFGWQEHGRPRSAEPPSQTCVYQDEQSGRFVTTVMTQDGGVVTQWPTPSALMFSREVAAYFRWLQTDSESKEDRAS